MKAILKLVRVSRLWMLAVPIALNILGAASNQVAIIANHGTMPVMENPATVAVLETAIPFGGKEYIDPIHSVMNKDTRLWFLCDIFNFHVAIASVGDLTLDLSEWLWTWVPYVWGALLFLKVYRLTV